MFILRGQNLDEFWSKSPAPNLVKIGQHQNSLVQKAALGLGAIAPRPRAAVCRNSYDFDAILTKHGAGQFGQNRQSFDPIRINTP